MTVGVWRLHTSSNRSAAGAAGGLPGRVCATQMTGRPPLPPPPSTAKIAPPYRGSTSAAEGRKAKAVS